MYAALADVAIVVPMFIFGFATMSLTLISEAVRVALMLVVELYSFFILRAVHRDRLRKFRFGIVKLEQFCNLAIGAALVASGLWIGNHVILSLLSGDTIATPLGLAVAAVVNGVNTLINAVGFVAMLIAKREDDSAVFRAQLRARRVKLIASLIVQATITLAALAADPTIALWFDGIGGAFVATLQISIGIRMVTESLPDLLDYSVSKAMKTRIDELLAGTNLGPADVLAIRTRCAGFMPHVEITLAPAGCVTVDDFYRRAKEVRTAVEGDFNSIELGIIFDTTDSTQGHP